jgi:hypothetical protein
VYLFLYVIHSIKYVKQRYCRVCVLFYFTRYARQDEGKKKQEVKQEDKQEDVQEANY